MPAATRFNAVVSPHRVFDTRRFGVDEFERIRALVPGATLNDAVVAVCAGGLRRYLESQAELPQSDLTALVPPGLGADAATAAGPRHVRIGTNIADPVQRLAWIHAQTTAPSPEAGLPPPACTITHVPGPARPVFLHGARLSYFSAILPIADGMGLVFAVTGYDGRIVVSPTSCRELMPDPLAFTQGLRDSFQQLLRRSGPRRASTSAGGTPSPAARRVRSAATRPPAAPAGPRRSTARRR
jgi:hypothetical protein